ncbi:MAG: PIN domain nuclease, partial [Ectothiorhodospira sp.]
MILLLDTHLLLWAASQPERLSATARERLMDENNALWFSDASLWEVTIKSSLGRSDFRVDPYLLKRGLIDNGYTELPITSGHALAVHH